MIVNKTNTFEEWLLKLKDKQGRIKIVFRIRKIEEENYLGDYKSVGDGVYELRIHYGPGYRIYFAYENNNIVLLLIGGDKSTQSNDINKAKIINNNRSKYE